MSLTDMIIENARIRLQEAYEDDLDSYNQEVTSANLRAKDMLKAAFNAEKSNRRVDSTLEVDSFSVPIELVRFSNGDFVLYIAGDSYYCKNIDKPAVSSLGLLEHFADHSDDYVDETQKTEFFKALVTGIDAYVQRLNDFVEQGIVELNSKVTTHNASVSSYKTDVANMRASLDARKQGLNKSFLNDYPLTVGSKVFINKKPWTVESIDENAGLVKMTSENGATRRYRLDFIKELYVDQKLGHGAAPKNYDFTEFDNLIDEASYH